MNIPNSLVECYSNASLLSHAALPTFGIGQFIDLIRKVENNRWTPMDMKNLAVQLTQRSVGAAQLRRICDCRRPGARRNYALLLLQVPPGRRATRPRRRPV